MFHIKVGAIAEECWQLEYQRNEVNSQIFELENAIGSLESLSGMEDCISRLKRQLSELREQHFVLGQMTQRLNQALLTYINCENRICDNGQYADACAGQQNNNISV